MLMRALVLLIGLFMIGDAAAQVVTAPPVVDPRQDMVALKPGSATATVAAPPAIPAAERVAGGNPLWTIPLGSLNVTRERPVFTPSRRPPAAVIAKAAPMPVAAPPKPPEPEKLQLSLVGTVVAETGEGIGIFMNPVERTALRLKIGENHKGWVLRAVRRGQAEFAKGPENVVLDLPQPGTTKAAALTPPAAPAAPANLATAAAERVVPVSSTPVDPSSPPNNAPTGGVAPQPPTGAPVVATIVVGPPVLTPPAPIVIPFQRRGLP
jgi:hypothetical protein